MLRVNSHHREELQALHLDRILPLAAGAIVVTYLPLPVTLDALERELEQGYHILHIVAHGAVSKNGDRTLFLADASNHVAHVSDTTFAEMIERKDTTLRLVFFASCQSAKRIAQPLGDV